MVKCTRTLDPCLYFAISYCTVVSGQASASLSSAARSCRRRSGFSGAWCRPSWPCRCNGRVGWRQPCGGVLVGLGAVGLRGDGVQGPLGSEVVGWRRSAVTHLRAKEPTRTRVDGPAATPVVPASNACSQGTWVAGPSSCATRWHRTAAESSFGQTSDVPPRGTSEPVFPGQSERHYGVIILAGYAAPGRRRLHSADPSQ